MCTLLFALSVAASASAPAAQTSVLSLSPVGIAHTLGEDGEPTLAFAMDFQQSVGRRSLIVQGGSGLVSAAVGPSVGRARLSRLESATFVGLYASGRAGIAVREGIGLGVEAFLNANSVMPVAGGRFVLLIGCFPGRRGDPPPPRVPIPRVPVPRAPQPLPGAPHSF